MTPARRAALALLGDAAVPSTPERVEAMERLITRIVLSQRPLLGHGPVAEDADAGREDA